MIFLINTLNVVHKIHNFSEYIVQEGDKMYSICSYIAETEEAINLVEGEKVFVIGQYSININIIYNRRSV